MSKLMNAVIVIVAISYFGYKSTYVNPVSYLPRLHEKLEGPLSTNERLDKTERLHENKIHWPESLAVVNGDIYTGLGDGRIVKVTGDKVADVCRIGSACEGQHEEDVCGRPLGMVSKKQTNLLYVVDAYHGLFVVNTQTGEKKNLVPASKTADNLPLTFMNDLAFDASEENLYISQSTTKWNISHVLVSIAEHESSGRLLKYNLATKTLSVVLKDLPFPNGVELSHNGKQLILIQGLTNTILKYHIEKKVQQKLAVILPGGADNIVRNKKGNYWLSYSFLSTKESKSILDLTSEHPMARKIFIHFYKVITGPISFLLNLLPYKGAQEFAFELKSMRILADITPSAAGVLEIDDAGNILQSLQSPSGKVSHISEVLEHGGHLYIGSWRNHYLGRLKLDPKS